MRMTRASFFSFEQVARVANFVELLIMCHVKGFDILLGSYPPPDARTVHIMLNSRRALLPDDYVATMRNLETEAERIIFDKDFFDETVKIAGGWKHINHISRDFKTAAPRYWGIVLDHVRYVGIQTERCGSKLGYVAARHHVSVNTVLRYRREFSARLSEYFLMPEVTPEDFAVFTW